MTEINENVDTYDPDDNAFGHGLFIEEAGVKPAYHFYDAIDFFDETQDGDFLSNFYQSPFTVSQGVVTSLLYSGIEATQEQLKALASHIWPTGEHFFQAFKADNFAQVAWTAAAHGPGEAKALGRRCSMRPDWTVARVEVMRAALAAKFAPASGLAQRLLDTDTRVLIEGTMWHDRIWGVYKGEGQNLLGVLLMEQRGFLKAVRDGRCD